ncbi:MULTISPECIES: response regulator transcription factor [unclassified Paludibacterium]|uniref:response regulator transcription factor n=1 Tax=unclassified Paludibacterium TaxID=2618429 RepID=UPI001C05828C|nr:response regulator transcription factor [Paludibacterium sp. B53371]BEV72648.1 response regulator transcription factor [Paludibacterium sp. THUN1379]
MRLLLVEDERTLRQQLADTLRTNGYVVDEAEQGQEAWFMGDTENYDAVILDLGLPGMDGISVLKRWRQNARSMPVLILTARDSWHDKVEGIDAGADDYLAKPFHMEELLARVRALIRRAHGLASPLLSCHNITLDTRSGKVCVSGVPVNLTRHEYLVLAYLMHRPDTIISRSELTEHIYAQDYDRDSNTIEVFIGRLRKKLPTEAIETLRGLGYRLNKG